MELPIQAMLILPLDLLHHYIKQHLISCQLCHILHHEENKTRQDVVDLANLIMLRPHPLQDQELPHHSLKAFNIQQQQQLLLLLLPWHQLHWDFAK